jgi:hypothetical protein
VGADQFTETPPEQARIVQSCLIRDRCEQLPLRIEEARHALAFRSGELFTTSPNYDGEVAANENALYALHALENCMKLDTKDRRHAPKAS